MTSRWLKRLTGAGKTAGSTTITPWTTPLVAIAVAGCASAAPPAAPESTVRVIARFKADVPDPLDPAFLTRLADRSRVARIDPVRPMSGDAYVLQVACADPRAAQSVVDPCTAAIARLSRSDAVLGIEIDRREKHP